MHRAITTGLFTAALCVPLLHTDPAAAGIGACGDIHVEAQAMCEVVPPSVECEGMCTPVSVRGACAAKLEASCEGGCDDLPSVECSGSCKADCMASCTDLDPGKFDCQASCQGDCMARCGGACKGDEDGAQCEASCEASCEGECDASCDIELPEADCDAGCDASCEGSCTADANLDCQLECQSDGFADCELDVQGGCDLACQGEEGALFCDGEYIDHNDNLDKCITALNAALEVEVMGEAQAEGSCKGGGCMASASAKASTNCALTPGPVRTSWPNAIAMLATVAILLQRRRRRVC